MGDDSRRRRAAWGSLSYDAKRRTARIRYWAEGADGYRRRSKTIRNCSRKEAEEERARLLLDHGNDAPCPTVQQVWEKWALPDMERRVEDGDLAPGTLALYKRTWRLHVSPTWRAVPVDQVRPLAVQQWLSGLALTAAKNAVIVMTKAMDYATRYEWCRTNPMREKYLMPSKSTVSRMSKGTWKLRELEGLWRRLYGTWMEPAFLVAAFGGARVGESLGPIAKEIGLRKVHGVDVAIVPIRRQIDQNGNVVDRLKNDRSRRDLAIPGMAGRRILEIAESIDGSWFLTNNGMGRPAPRILYSEKWKGMGMEYPYRNLRNSWQTWMRWEMEVPPYYIESMMGHTVGGVTGSHYERPQADAFADVMAKAYLGHRYDEGWSVCGE